MVHLYCGEGKGKTTAAMGLALRMAGRGKRVVVAQFLKGADSGERYALAMLPQVTLLPLPERVKFSFQLTPEEREAEQVRYLALAEQARTLGAQPDCGLLVLDEVCAAVNTGLLPLEEVISCLDRGKWSSPGGTPTRPWWDGPTTSLRWASCAIPLTWGRRPGLGWSTEGNIAINVKKS